jgi:glyoxylase I family protein
MTQDSLRLDHLALPVFDAGSTYDFYSRVLGLKLIRALSGDDWGGYPWLMMIFGLEEGRTVSLCALRGAEAPPPGDLPADVRHFAFRTADLAVWRKRLAAAGVAFEEEDHGDQHSLYFRDPNGIVLEITSPPGSGAPEHDPDAEDRVRRWIDGLE